MTDHPAAATAYGREQAQRYDKQRFESAVGMRTHRAEADNLLWALQRIEKPGKVLEVGCGTGRLMVEALEHGYAVDGADASPEMLEMLRAKLRQEHPQVRLDVAEAAKLPYPDGSYDLVYSIRLLNQTESPGYALGAVAEMIRVTRPGGYALIEFVNHYRPRWGVAKRKTTTRLKPHEVAERALQSGAEVLGFRGAFFLSMQALQAAPRFLLPIVSGVDRMLSRMFPRLCSRTYILLRKKENG